MLCGTGFSTNLDIVLLLKTELDPFHSCFNMTIMAIYIAFS